MSESALHAVTGAFGYSGKYIATRLLTAGHRVITLTNSPNRPDPFRGQVEARPYDFTNVAKMAESLKGVQVLYNTYWVRFNHPLFKHADAVRNTLALFEAARMAGVERVVHVSITNADANSPFEYFSGKGHLENALKSSGLSYSILRPAVLFGPEDILINNIAWALRQLPVFCVFGDGDYHLQPIYVDDLAALAVKSGESRENGIVQAIGVEDYTYRDLVMMLGKTIGCERPIFSIPVWLGRLSTAFIGWLKKDVFVTPEEIGGLMADLLHVPGAEPTGPTKLSEWARQNAATLGIAYASEMARRVDRNCAY